jgi:dihydroorotate dehydrogenase
MALPCDRILDVYALLRPVLFSLNAETAHDLSLAALARAGSLTRLAARPVAGRPVELMGLRFPNAVGLAAGLDKNGAAIDGLAGLGFGFLEIGTVTPLAQPGNPQPRLFRLPRARAIINRMGFNNHGVATLLDNVRAARYRGILGINIGKNATTPLERAAEDYLTCLDAVYPLASYVTINISSPNTRNLRDLQSPDALGHLLRQLKARQQALAQQHGRQVPLLLKIAPDLDEAQIVAIAGLLRHYRMDGVIATNTTLARDAVAHLPHSNESGGLSGAPLTAPSTRIITRLAQALGGEVPIIGVGGIFSARDAADKLAAGASLVQIYSGLIYRGPALVRECVTALRHD